MTATRDLAGNRVLIVEDDSTVSALLVRALHNRNYQVEAVASVAGALEIATTWQPQVAVVDIKLGNESGLQLLEPLLQLNPGIRIIVLTGYASIATAVQAIKLGASDYLAKPVQMDELLAALTGSRPTASLPNEQDVPTLRRLEWEHIQRVLNQSKGNISEAARILGMERRTLQRKLAKRPVKK